MCKYIEASSVMPGWGCCRCRIYNGLQRQACKNCRADRCPAVDEAIPADMPRCAGCGLGYRAQHLSALGPTCPSCGAPLAQKPAEANP